MHSDNTLMKHLKDQKMKKKKCILICLVCTFLFELVTKKWQKQVRWADFIIIFKELKKKPVRWSGKQHLLQYRKLMGLKYRALI